MKIKELLDDYGIPYNEVGKNISDGWIGLNCPFCNDPSDHLGYNLDEDYGEMFSCWRCGPHSVENTLSSLIGVSQLQARQIIIQYKGGKSREAEKETTKEKKPFAFPSNTGPLNKRQKNYLAGRGFDPEYLEAAWNLCGTGPASTLGFSDYKFRIIAPIYWSGKIVSFQGRDITDKSLQRYKACPEEYEITHHKDILYLNKRRQKIGGIGFCCEGFTDVWRLGFDAFATFGTKYTPRQLRWMSQLYDQIYILFDPEDEAQEQAEKLAGELRFRGKKTENILLDDDPGSMHQDDADYLVKQLKHKKL